MAWQSNFELDIQGFDDHHKHLVDLINQLHTNLTSGLSKEILGNVFRELIDYASYHFDAEENWMREINYPDSSKHQDYHTAFINKVKEFQENFKNGEADLTIEMLHFLVDWLFEHILKIDAAYAGFARA